MTRICDLERLREALSRFHEAYINRAKAGERSAYIEAIRAVSDALRISYGNLEQYSLSAISALAERVVAALVPR